MNTQPTIIILGGGIGGIVAANVLAKKVGKVAKIVLIDKQKNHMFPPALLHLMLGERKLQEVLKPLSLLEKKGVEVVSDEVTKINHKEKTVTTKNHQLSYDYLVIALGAQMFPENIVGLRTGYNLYSFEDADKLKTALENFKKGKIAIVISSLPFKCPAAPYEAALLLDAYFTKKKLRQNIELSVFTPEPLPMPSAGAVIGNAIKDMLQSRTINFYPNVGLQEVLEKTHQLVFATGAKYDFDLLLFIPPHQGTTVIKEAGLGNETGFIPVDKHTLETTYPNVFAIGDANVILLSSGKPLPKAGVFAHAQAQVVADIIVSRIKGRKETKKYDGKASCFLETGFGKAGFASGNLYTEPLPLMNMKQPSKIWYLLKMKYEKYWLWKWF